MAVLLNGTSSYDIKEMMTKQIAPKYFDSLNPTELNIGLYGYVTEILSTLSKDSYFSITSLFKEIFPLQAELPESLYNHAILFQLSNIFATPSSVPFAVLVAEDAVINASTEEGNYMYFDMDSNMEFIIDGIPFMLDYDVRIYTRKTINGYVHSAQYIMDRTNAISGLLNPYILSTIYVNQNKKKYILLEVILHQVSKKTVQDTIINNDKINVVTLEYRFSGTLANFEIFYKAPTDSSYTQLKKLLANSVKVDSPFCFYKLIDKDKLQISFANDDRFFMPVYNSDVIVELYTTKGEAGNFKTYEGTDISIVGSSDKYASNRGIIFVGTTRGAAVGGKDAMDLEDLRNETVKSYSTVKSFTTTGDLHIYFDNLMESLKTKMVFMKKRDDAFERLYSAFILFRDKDNNVIPTNTLDMRIYTKDISMTIEQTHRNVIPAGLLYEYVNNTTDAYVKVCEDIKISDNLDEYEKTKFLYVNPFLTIVCTNPTSVGFYINTINTSHLVQHVNINAISFNQFIIDNFTVKRDAIAGEDEYLFTVRLSPTASLDKEAFKLRKDDTYVSDTDRTFINEYDGYEYVDNQNLKVMFEVVGKYEESKLYVIGELVGFDDDAYIFQAKLKTNDYISTAHDLQVTGGFRHVNTFSEEGDPVLIPSTDCKINIYTFYKYPDTETKQTHEFAKYEEFEMFTLTNKYATAESNYVNFVVPVQEIRSYVEYSMKEANGRYGFRLESVPLIKANYLKLDGVKDAFMENFYEVYSYIQQAMDRLTNNFHIDLKFFNTYGYSEHYFISNREEEHIDKINISMYFDAKYTLLSNEDSLTEELAEFIKNYVEVNQISLVSSPSLYASKMIKACHDKFSGLKYLILRGINEYGSDVQALESNVNESNIIQGVIETSKVIPEYLNIDHIIKDGVRTPQIFINVIH